MPDAHARTRIVNNQQFTISIQVSKSTLSVHSMKQFTLCVLLGCTIPGIWTFSIESKTPPQPNNWFQSLTSNLFSNESNAQTKEMEQERLKLKRSLLDLANNSNKNVKEKRPQLEVIMEDLQRVRPILNTASNPLLQKEWLL